MTAQRLALSSAPGSLLKRTLHAPTKRERFVPGDDAHLKAIRQLPCLRCGLDPCAEAAHIRMTSGVRHKLNAGAAKPADKWTLPICRACHQDDWNSIHRIGELAFFDALKIDPLLTAERLYAVSPDVIAMRAVVFRVTEERSRRSGT